MEPLNLKCWEIGVEPSSGLTFFTCARPGRSLGPDNRVPDDVVSSWGQRIASSQYSDRFASGSQKTPK